MYLQLVFAKIQLCPGALPIDRLCFSQKLFIIIVTDIAILINIHVFWTFVRTRLMQGNEVTVGCLIIIIGISCNRERK